MSKSKGLLVGVHFNKFTGGPGRVVFEQGQLLVRPRRREEFSYTGLLTVRKKRTEPPFANHWIELATHEGPVWLTCSRKRALRLKEEAEKAGLVVDWLAL